ncbi:MAG: AbrB/MazE/SpoVT family DNA-binding domain-containing protein [Polycyclovorans sp.]|jgi:AbrB family looped-hinge helix DNA binding protein
MYAVKVSEGGRVVIPAEVRRALEVREGDSLVLELKDGEVRLYSRREQLRRAQALFRQYIPEGVSLVDELIAERRAEAARE